jgi:hypothetical protein
MRLRVAAALALLTAVPAVADCVGDGHYAIAAAARPLTGSRFPYTEDLAPATRVVVPFHDDLRWVKLQGGCAASGGRNVLSSGPFNLLLRASFRLRYDPETTATPGTRYQVELRLGDTVVATAFRRLTGSYPSSERFAAALRDLPAGNYAYSMWLRLLDGPETNRVAVDLQWITAQGAPNVYGGARAETAADAIVGGDWTAVGPPMEVGSVWETDLALQSSFLVVDASAPKLSVGFTLDGAPPGDAFGSIAVPKLLPQGAATFDDKLALPAGRHVVQLVMRGEGGLVRVAEARAELVGFPLGLRRPEVIAMQRRMETQALFASTAGDERQPAAISPVCGRWTKLLEFDLAPSSGSFSWTLEGYVEIAGAAVSGYGQLAIVGVHREPDKNDPATMIDAATDMGMFEFQASAAGDGIYFYGDCSKWGNYNSTRLSLWIRRIEGCNDAPLGGGFMVGKRWLTVKLLPSEGRHLP